MKKEALKIANKISTQINWINNMIDALKEINTESDYYEINANPDRICHIHLSNSEHGESGKRITNATHINIGIFITLQTKALESERENLEKELLTL